MLVRSIALSAGLMIIARRAGVAPLAFNLDTSRGWRKFAIPDAVGSKALDPCLCG